MRILGVLLILFAVYTPISLFTGIQPFGMHNETIYVYEEWWEQPEFEGLIYDSDRVSCDIKRRVQTTVPIEHPENYNLTFMRTYQDFISSPWFYRSMLILVLGLAGGLILVLKGNKQNK